MDDKTIIAAVAVNDHGYMLPYTVQCTKQRCDEEMTLRYGEVWEKMKEHGARVMQCEIRLLE